MVLAIFISALAVSPTGFINCKSFGETFKVFLAFGYICKSTKFQSCLAPQANAFHSKKTEALKFALKSVLKEFIGSLKLQFKSPLTPI